MRQLIVLPLLVTFVIGAPAGFHTPGISTTLVQGSSIPLLHSATGQVNSGALVPSSVVSLRNIELPQWQSWSPGLVSSSSVVRSSSTKDISGVGSLAPASTIAWKSANQPLLLNWSPAVLSSVDSGLYTKGIDGRYAGLTSTINVGPSVSSSVVPVSGNIASDSSSSVQLKSIPSVSSVVSPISSVATWNYPAVRTIAWPSVSAVPLTKTIHYETKPVVTGYSTQIIKSGQSSLATNPQIVSKQKVQVAGRPVAKITPQITRVEPEVNVQRVPVDVPVAQPVAVPTPVVKEIEYTRPVVEVQSAPAVYSAVQNVEIPSSVWQIPSVSVKEIEKPSPVQLKSTVESGPVSSWSSSVAVKSVQGPSTVLTNPIASWGSAVEVKNVQIPSSVWDTSAVQVPSSISDASSVNVRRFQLPSSVSGSSVVGVKNVQVPSSVWDTSAVQVPSSISGASSVNVQNSQGPYSVSGSSIVGVKNVQIPSSVWDTSAVQESSSVSDTSSVNIQNSQLPSLDSGSSIVGVKTVGASYVPSYNQQPIGSTKKVGQQDLSYVNNIIQTQGKSLDLGWNNIGELGAPPSLAVRTANTAPGWVTTTW